MKPKLLIIGLLLMGLAAVSWYGVKNPATKTPSEDSEKQKVSLPDNRPSQDEKVPEPLYSGSIEESVEIHATY